MQQSIWNQTQYLQSAPVLEGDVKTDVLVIGGGMAGLLCAHRLRELGVNCLVLEADRIARGVTAGTTAKITSQHGWCYHKLLRDSGWHRARDYFRANQAALEELCRLGARIPCDLEREDNYIYATDQPETLETELEALSRLGIPGEYVAELDLPLPTAGAVCFRNQARFHPLKFLGGLVPGLEIREHSRVLKIQGNQAFTARGCVTAEKILVATHFPIVNRHGLYFMKQYQDRSYVLALEGAGRVNGMYLDGSGQGFSFRMQADQLLLGGSSHRTGKSSGGWAPLSSFAQAHYPGARETARWAAQDCMTLDGIPYIGRYSPHTPNLYVATGFNKWGMTGSMLAAMVLGDLLLGKKSPWEELTAPHRRVLRPQLALNAWESAVNLLTPSRPRCPHMGCALKWNPWEHSWDCPCHGSRFSDSGGILESPATKPMEKDRQ